MTRTNNENFYKYSLIFIFASAWCFTTAQGHVLEFIVEPSDTVVEAGQSAVLDCMVKASNHQSSVLIQWLDQDGSKLNFIGDMYRSQLTNGSLYINNVIEEQRLTGTYRCMASMHNVGSIISRTAKLSIASLSGFHEEPSDIVVYIGQKAHFTCNVNAIPAPKIRWLKDERPLQYDQLRMTLLPSGALEIDEVVESDQGSYRCNASGLSSSKLSNKANLIINVDYVGAPLPSPPVFIAKPHSQIVIEGQNVSLDCAANGNPNPTITWLKDGYGIDMNYLDSRFSLVGTTKSLLITNIQEQDAGTYQCRAENREDSLDASANIHVQVPPRFLKRPQDKIETEKRDIELECEVYGVPEPIVQWYKNGEIITKSEYYRIVNGNNLKIMGLLTTDSGLFQCFASNPAGNIQAVANLRVTGKRKKPSNKSYAMQALGDTKYAFKHKNTDPSSVARESLFSLQSSGDSFSINNNNNNLGKTETAYSSKYPKPIPASSHDEKNSTDGLPGPPKDVRAPLIKARFIILKWEPPTVNADNIITYSVYYRQEGSIRERHQNASRTHLEEVSIGDLMPDKVYHFRVVAINENGAGPSSESLSITTQYEEHVSTAPQQFEAYALSPRTIEMSWTPPENPNGRIVRYTIYYIETSKSIEHRVDTTKLVYRLNNLRPYTEYSIWVVAVNENGRGAATEELNVVTYSDIPTEPPQNVTIEPSSTSIIIRWEEPPIESQNGILLGYKLKYRKAGKKPSTITTTADKRHYVINDLELATTYQVKIAAMNVNGTGPSIEWTDVKTFDNDLDESTVPPQPAYIRVRPSSDKLYILWAPPLNQKIRIRSYQIGWGKGIPDMYSQELDERSRTYIIDRLDPNSEYVLSLRACNEMGAGPPIYTTIKTEDEPPPEQPTALMPPVGLKAQVLSTTSVVLYWTDPSLAKNQQFIRDNRLYRVKFTDEKQKSKYLNVSALNVMIQDLKPNTLYEFSVRLIKGRKESSWSMVVQNRTFELPPNLPPRDLDVHLKDEESQLIELTWQPPKLSTGRITGYVILYTDNETKSDPEWQVIPIKGDNHSTVIYNLRPFTLYYFKVQARNSRGYGPFSNTATFRTGAIVATMPSSQERNEAKGIFSGNVLLAMIIGGCIVALVTITVVVTFLCCRKKSVTSTLDRSKKGYQKGTQNIKPPDLWIHHDQMELKAMEKRHSTNDGASSSGAMTLPRSVGGNEYDNHDGVHTNSLDKRNYGPNYAIATPVNNSAMSQSSSDSTPSSRPPYPRTQYSMSRAHVSLDPSVNNQQQSENVYTPHQIHPNYDNSTPSASYINQPPVVSHSSSGGYAPGLSAMNDNQGTKRVQAQGHPLKSFTVPAPPPISAPSTPQPKHIVTVRPNTSPYKKPPTSSSSTLTSTPPSRISASNPPPHTAEEVQRLQPSHSTEELNQEMANLEGLMLTLNAITANEFEC